MDAIKHFTEGMIKENKPQFEVGDTVRVSVRIKEGDKERIQAFEGTVIAKKHGGIAETFTVRLYLLTVSALSVCSRSTARSLKKVEVRSPRQGPSCEALLPARAHRQGRQGQGTHLSILQKRGGRLAFSLFSYFCI